MIDLSTYMSHLHFLKFSLEIFKCVVVIWELEVSNLKNIVYQFDSDLGITLASNLLSVNLFGYS